MAGALVNLPPDIVAAETSRGRILVVDDEPDIRESLETLLSQEGYQVGSPPTPPKVSSVWRPASTI